MKRFKMLRTGLMAWMLVFSGCTVQQRSEGPFFGNGFRNGMKTGKLP